MPSIYSGWRLPVPQGGVFGRQKWAPGNGLDVFLPRGSPVFASFSGTIQPYSVPSPVGPVPGFRITGANGITQQVLHVVQTAQGRVEAGQRVGTINDSGLDILGRLPSPFPDNYQHADITYGNGGGPFPVTGGNINAFSVLQDLGYQGTQVQQTPGPQGGGSGGILGPIATQIGNTFGGLLESWRQAYPTSPFSQLQLPAVSATMPEESLTSNEALGIGNLFSLGGIGEAIEGIKSAIEQALTPGDDPWHDWNQAFKELTERWEKLFQGSVDTSSANIEQDFPKFAIAAIIGAVGLSVIERWDDNIAFGIMFLLLGGLFLTNQGGQRITGPLTEIREKLGYPTVIPEGT